MDQVRTRLALAELDDVLSADADGDDDDAAAAPASGAGAGAQGTAAAEAKASAVPRVPVGMTRHIGLWLYALLCKLDKPINAEVASLLRSLYRHTAEIRSRLVHTAFLFLHSHVLACSLRLRLI